MKHCILVKFVKDFNWKGQLPNIQNIFSSITIEGFHYAEFITNCVDRENRYDLLIRLDLDQDSLSLYDECENHKQWKEEYSKYIDKKAIFDYK